LLLLEVSSVQWEATPETRRGRILGWGVHSGKTGVQEFNLGGGKGGWLQSGCWQRAGKGGIDVLTGFPGIIEHIPASLLALVLARASDKHNKPNCDLCSPPLTLPHNPSALPVTILVMSISCCSWYPQPTTARRKPSSWDEGKDGLYLKGGRHTTSVDTPLSVQLQVGFHLDWVLGCRDLSTDAPLQ